MKGNCNFIIYIVKNICKLDVYSFLILINGCFDFYSY